MRVSVHDPDFIRGTRVFVNGADVTYHVHTADDLRGMAWGYDSDAAGRHYAITDPLTGECDIAPKLWTGSVKIALPSSR